MRCTSRSGLLASPTKKVVRSIKRHRSRGYLMEQTLKSEKFHILYRFASSDRIFAIGGNVRTTNLPEQGEPTPGGKAAVLAGWGYPYSLGPSMENLQRVDIEVYTDEDCESAYVGKTGRDYHVCVGVLEGGKGQCNDDSGGPLTVDDVQAAIVYWSMKPCAKEGYPGVFAKISSYVDWIRQQMI